MLISPAYAQAAAGGTESTLLGMLPLVLMFVVLYFVMIRPQLKRQKEHKAMVEALAKGEVVLGGIKDYEQKFVQAKRILIVDPVMIAKGGQPLLKPDAIDILKSALFPLALLVTPNVHEAQQLSGIEITSLADARRGVIVPGAFNAMSARLIADLGFEAIYVTGAGVTNMWFGMPDQGFMGAGQHLDQGALATSAPIQMVR